MIAGAMKHGVWVWFALWCAACTGQPAAADLPAEGEVVEPPFAVRGEAEGLLLAWFDDEGLHTATRRSDIPEEHRQWVRVDDLSLPPEQRLDPDLVYVADLRRTGTGGRYTVRRMARASFDARVSRANDRPAEPVLADTGDAPAPSGEGSDVVIYGASWCGACRSAASFLRSRGIPFIERDVERDPGARDAMLRAARAAGIRPNGIPVIDFRGRVMAGFDQGALERAIAETRPSAEPRPEAPPSQPI
jgi:glutaredoxin